MSELSPSIEVDGETDLILHAGSIWITVGNISVYVKKTDEGVVVDMYPKGHEASDGLLLGAIWVTFEEAEMPDSEDE